MQLLHWPEDKNKLIALQTIALSIGRLQANPLTVCLHPSLTTHSLRVSALVVRETNPVRRGAQYFTNGRFMCVTKDV